MSDRVGIIKSKYFINTEVDLPFDETPLPEMFIM